MLKSEQRILMYNNNIIGLFNSVDQVPEDNSYSSKEWIELILECAANKFCMSAAEFFAARQNYLNSK